MNRSLLAFSKFFFLIGKGISIRKAFFFSKWEMIHDVNRVKNYKVNGQFLKDKRTNQSLPVKSLSLINFNAAKLEKLFEFAPQYSSEGLYLHYVQPDGTPINSCIDHTIGFAIFREVFEEGVYAFDLESDNVIVIDIGANIALATLYFASKVNVRKVYSFELIPETFTKAKKNISLNAFALDKVNLNNVAVSNYNGTVKIPTQFGGSAHTSLSQTIYNETAQEGSTNEVAVRRASEVVAEIKERYFEPTIVLKLDCEGEEYKILDELSETNCLRDIDLIMIEWHVFGQQPLLDHLRRNGFVSFAHKGSTGDETGMIYAAKFLKNK